MSVWAPSSAGRLSHGQTELIHTIRRCGLTSGLKLCLDAGDANSYSGSGQSWLDTSGNGYDFFRGTTSGADATDPTFNGTAGRRSSGEYWSVDGGDYFKYDTTNETWMNNLHKDNAKFTLLGWVYFSGNGTTIAAICGTRVASFNGIFLARNSTTFKLSFHAEGASTAALEIATAATISLSAWHYVAISLDEAVGANGAIMQVDGVQELFTSTYVTPSSTNPASPMEIWAIDVGNYLCPSGSLMGMFAAWEGVALTQTQLRALFMATRGRFGV